MKHTLIENATTDHETAEDWYAKFGWHLSTRRAGDVELQAVDFAWLDESDASAVAALLESDPDLTEDEAEQIVGKAREVRDMAEAVEASLASAVEAYERGDLEGVIAALDEARSVEREAGDTPASDALRTQLVQETDEDEVYTLIEYMPRWLRESHRAAGNAGRYPHNGAARVWIAGEVDTDVIDEWTSIVRVAHRLPPGETALEDLPADAY